MASFNKSLRFLFLADNLITGTGALMLMRPHPALEWLDLSGNLVTSGSALTLLQARGSLCLRSSLHALHSVALGRVERAGAIAGAIV